MGFEEDHPTCLGCTKDPRYLLNIGIPAQQVGELQQSARSMGLEGTLSETMRKAKETREKRGDID